MDRRFLTVLGVSLLFALVVSGIFYQMTARGGSPKKEDKPELRDVVTASRPLPVGVSIKPADVKLGKIPADQFPKGGFSKIEEVIDRPVISNILGEEAILEGRLAARGSGLGLAPVIPVGMRAVSVRVNEVVGVSGFVLPGMRVDVLVTGRPPGAAATVVTTTVLQNILVLSAGQNIQADAKGGAINAPTVTLLVTPQDAETLTLAGTEGHIQLVLRNGSDQTMEKTAGRELAELYGARLRKLAATPDAPPAPAKPRPRPQPAQQVASIAPPPKPLPPPPDEVVVIRGTTKTVEVVKKHEEVAKNND